MVRLSQAQHTRTLGTRVCLLCREARLTRVLGGACPRCRKRSQARIRLAERHLAQVVRPRRPSARPRPHTSPLSETRTLHRHHETGPSPVRLTPMRPQPIRNLRRSTFTSVRHRRRRPWTGLGCRHCEVAERGLISGSIIRAIRYWLSRLGLPLGRPSSVLRLANINRCPLRDRAKAPSIHPSPTKMAARGTGHLRAHPHLPIENSSRRTASPGRTRSHRN